MEKLKTKKKNLKSSVSKFKKYVDKFDQDTGNIEELKVRLTKIQSAIDDYEVNQIELELLEHADVDALIEERDAFEEGYYYAVGKAHLIIKTVEARQIASNGSTVTVDNSQNHSKVQLPKLTLQKFDGSYAQWLSFKDNFSSSIHNNNTLSNIEKFQYLKGVLQGEALQLVNPLLTTTDNYTIAWDLLKNRYENQRIIINSHMQAIFELQSITKESSHSIRKMIDNFQMHVRALEALGEEVQHWDTILIYLLTTKLDSWTRRAWELELGEKNQSKPKLKELIKFLSTRCQVLELSEGSKKQLSEKPNFGKKHVTLSTTTQSCSNCKNNHQIFQCDKFLKLNPAQRMEKIKELRLCINCLKAGHFTRECLSTSTCKMCKSKHNTLLHVEKQRNKTSEEDIQSKEETRPSEEKSNTGVVATASYVAQKSNHDVLLATAIIDIIDSQGIHHEARAALDAGSQLNFIKKELIDKLNINCKSINFQIQGITGATTKVTQSAKVKIKSKYNNYNAILNCLVVNNITQPLPQIELDRSKLNIPQVNLADPEFYVTREIDLLIGGELFWNLMYLGQIKLQKGQPILQKTPLGWIVAGPILGPITGAGNKIHSAGAYHCTAVTIQDQLEKFWNIEEISTKSSNYSPEELQCEEIYKNTVSRTNSGRFIVSLLQKENIHLGDSLSGAQKRLFYMERRLNNDVQLKQDYSRFMKEYNQLGHMTEVSDESLDTKEVFYLPHHAVIKNDSLTTKVRVVFDGSFKSTNGNSLNDKLLVGPTIQDDLINIILRFRIHQCVITADIAMMFRQILIRPEERSLQRICWRNPEEESVKYYELNTVTYGTASAPYLAARTLKQLAVEDGSEFPTAKNILERDFYMDDVLTGADTEKEAIQLQKDLTALLSKGGFALRKWRTNKPEILNHLQAEKKTTDLLIIDKQEAVKTLGLLWDSKEDTINYTIKNTETLKVTKRTILSKIATIFDPLGLLGPIIIFAKILLQDLWKLKLEWDESVPIHIYTEWQNFAQSLDDINRISIQRNVNPNNTHKKIDLHGFCDASEKSYGACIYVCSQTTDEEYNLNLLCAKSKVAPLKIISLPRLELCGALTLSRLIRVVQQSLGDRINKIYLWSDSTIALAWIKTEPYKLKTFVSNRVAEIQRLTLNMQWMHINTAQNPADIISRGMTTEQLLQSNLWWHGSSWIFQCLPNKDSLQHSESEEEHKPALITLIAVKEKFDLLEKYSRFYKLQKAVALCLKVIKIWKYKKKGITFEITTIKEIEEATIKIIELVQRESFKTELEDLKSNKLVKKQSTIFKLQPFLDNNLIRVGGRLKHANLPYNHKYPYVLPYSHHVTQLIAKHEHERLLHCGPEQLLSSIRTNYWPLSGRRLSRKIVHNCIVCYRSKPIPLAPEMGILPKSRVTETIRPFMITGIDYAGPIQLKQHTGRGRQHITKAYIGVFVCFNTKAIHLELITDLTTESFLAALRRFFARRGLSSHIYSDNGTHFVGASNQLNDVYNYLMENQEDIISVLTKQRVEWHFIPPRSPHFGGLWESAVKAMKTHFYKITKDVILTYEQCYTLLVEIEAVLNSRPLTPLSSHPTDLQPLTPSHFLIGDLLISPPEHDYTSFPVNRLSKWEHIQKLKQHFWQRWQHEYLHQLQVRQKWHQQQPNIQVGDLVVMMEDNTPPMRWPMARVMETHPGEDQIVRVVTVKCANGLLKRPVRKLCLLPVQDKVQGVVNEGQ